VIDPARAAAALEARSLRLRAASRERLRASAAAVETLSARLQALNPHAVLARGYAIATDARGAIVRDAATLSRGDRLDVRLARGAAATEVIAALPVAPDTPAPAD